MKVARRIFPVIFLIALACAFALFKQRLAFDTGKGYIFYCGTSSRDCREIKTNSPALLRLALKDVCGECAEYDSLELEEFLSKVNAKVLFEEELSDSVNYYCSADLPYSVELYGQTVNLHICVKEDGVKVASPIIFGGY